MKRIIFLFCLLFLIVPTNIHASDTFDCLDSSIYIEGFRENQNRGMMITKNGLDSFQYELYKEGTDYHYNNVLCTEDAYIIYGFLHTEGMPTYYDSYVLFLDKNGDYQDIVINDYGMLEEMVHFYYFDQTYLSIVTQTYEDGEYQFQMNYIELYDSSMNVFKTIEIDSEIRQVEVLDHKVLINYQFDDEFDVAIYSNGEIQMKNHDLDINTEYYGSLELDYLNKLYANNILYEHGLNIDYPGHYDIVYQSNIYPVTIHPTITGVEDNKVYQSMIMIEYSSGYALLNGNPYISSEVIEEPGNYTFVIEGANGYQKELNFTIKPQVTGVIHGHSYERDVSIEFTGNAYLNGKLVESPLYLDTPGEYVLQVIGTGGYMESYDFSILSSNSEHAYMDWIYQLDIFLVIVIVILGVLYLKKK